MREKKIKIIISLWKHGLITSTTVIVFIHLISSHMEQKSGFMDTCGSAPGRGHRSRANTPSAFGNRHLARFSSLARIPSTQPPVRYICIYIYERVKVPVAPFIFWQVSLFWRHVAGTWTSHFNFFLILFFPHIITSYNIMCTLFLVSQSRRERGNIILSLLFINLFFFQIILSKIFFPSTLLWQRVYWTTVTT